MMAVFDGQCWAIVFYCSFDGYVRLCSDTSETVDEAVPLPQLGTVCWLCFDDQSRVLGG